MSVAAIVLAIAGLVGGRAIAFEAIRLGIAIAHPSVRPIEGVELAALLAGRREQRPLLLDARSEAEVSVSHLRRARRIDPDRPELDRVDRATPIVVYCSVGIRSARVAEDLRAAGFGDVRNLDGGIFAWAMSGRPVYHGDRSTRVVHPFDVPWAWLLRSDIRARFHR